MKNKKGFTLVELIIVIAVIAILAGAIFVAIDPARRLHESRNAVRSSDVATILDGVVKYQADNEGDNYTTVDAISAGKYVIIGTEVDDGLCAEEDTAAAACANTATTSGTATCVDLSGIGSNYLAKVPSDPETGTDEDTRYYMSVGTNGAITVGACNEEGEGAGGTGTAPVIEVTR